MESSTPRQQQIIDVARKIITTRGTERLTIHELAGELNLTDGAIYRHFKSKNEIIVLLIDDIENTLFSEIGKAESEAFSSLDKLKNIFFSHLSYAEQRRGVSFIIINETLNLKDRKLQKKMLSLVEHYLNKIEEVLREGIRSREVRKDLDTRAAAIAFFGSVQSLCTFWALNGFRFLLQSRYARHIFDLYLKSVVKEYESFSTKSHRNQRQSGLLI